MIDITWIENKKREEWMQDLELIIDEKEILKNIFDILLEQRWITEHENENAKLTLYK